MKPLLIHVQPREGPNGARIDVRLNSGGSAAAAGLGGFRWFSAVQRRPRLTQELLAPALDGRIQVGRGDFVINLKGIREPATAGLYWNGAPVVIYDARTLDLATAPIEFKGFVRSSAPDTDAGTITLNLEVSVQALEKPVLYAEFTGAGGINGAADFRGKVKPAGFGSVKNIEPVWFDPTNNIGMIDGYGNCTAITALFEGANDFGARVADYADYATLAARIADKTVAPGRWATCVAQGLIGLGAPPVQPITADATFGTNRPGALIRRLMESHAGVLVADVDVAAFAALDAAVNRAVHHWMGDQREVKDLIEAIAASCNATPVVTFQGKYSVTRAFGGANIATFNRQASVAKPRVTMWKGMDAEAPVWRMKMRAARPGVVLSTDQILYADDLIDRGAWLNTETYRQGHLVWSTAGAQFLYINAVPAAGQALPVLPATANAHWQRTKAAPAAGDLFYADGTAIEALKPAQVGADVTGANTAAAIIGQAPTATSSNYNVITGATRPADYAGTSLTLVAAGGATLAGNGFVSGSVSSSNIVDGAALTSFNFTSAPAASYSTTGLMQTNGAWLYALHVGGAGHLYAYDPVAGHNGPLVNPADWSAASRFTVTYDKVTARLWKDGVQIASRIVTATTPVKFFAESYVSTAAWANIQFQPFGVQADINSNLVDSFGGTIYTLPRSEVRTPLGTAAAIAGQAPTATSSDYSVITGPTRPADYATRDLTLAPSGSSGAAAVSIVGNKATKLDATTAYGTAAVYTTFGFGGGARLAAYGSYGQEAALGLVNGVSANIEDAIFNIRTKPDLSVDAYYGGSLQQANITTAVDGGSRLELRYDNVRVQAFRDGALIYTWTQLPPVGSVYYGNIHFKSLGSNWRDITWTPSAILPNVNSGIVDNFGGTIYTLPRNEIRTPLGTAAAIAGQAATATSSDYSVITGATRPAPYADVATPLANNGTVTDFTIQGNKIEKTGGVGTAWTVAEMHTPTIVGPQRLSWQMNNPGYGLEMAVSLHPGLNAAVDGHAHQVRVLANRSIEAWSYYTNNGVIALAAAWDGNSLFDFVYDDVTVQFRIDGVAKYTWPIVGTAQAYRGHFLFKSLAALARNIVHTPYKATADVNANVVDSYGGSIYTLPRGEVRTPLGTAAAIAGQGAFATVSTAAYGSALLTGFGTLAPRNKVSLADGFIFRADTTTSLTEALAITSLGTASAILNQAATATSSDFSAITGLTKPEANADVTITVSGPSTATILYNSGNTAIDATVPLAFTRKDAAGVQTTGVTASYTVLEGTVNGFTPASGAQALAVTSGVATLTVNSLATATGLVKVTMTKGGVPKDSVPVTLTKELASAPPPSGGSSASQTSGFTAISTGAFVDISGVLSVTITATKVLRITVNLTPKANNTATSNWGPWNIEAQVYRGASTEGAVQNSNPDPYIDDVPEIGIRNRGGTLSFTLDTAALVAGTYTFKIQARISSGALPNNGTTIAFTVPAGGGFKVEQV